MAVELATAYINIVSSSQGLGQSITNDLATAESDASSSGDRAGKGFVAAFGGVVAAGLAVGAVAKGLYEVGATFDDVSDTIRVGTGATGTALEGLVSSAEKVGTQVPASFEQASSVVADLNTRLGLTGGTLETVASQYLAAGNILGEDIDIQGTTAAFSAFGIKGDEVSGAMDKLFQVSQATGVGFNELASSVQSQAPALQTLGFSFDQTAGLIGNLDKAGLNSTAVVASLGKGLVKLAKDGEEPQAAFQRVTGEIGALIESGDKAGSIDLASGIFGTKGANQFIAAVESGTIAVGDLGTVAGITDDTILGAAAETADFAESLTLFKNNALLALKPAGDAAFGALSSAMAAAAGYAAPLGSVISNIFTILGSGDFVGGGPLAEDGPFVNGLFLIRENAQKAAEFLGNLAGVVAGTLGSAFSQVAALIGPGLQAAFAGILPAIGQVLGAVGPAFGAAFAGVGEVVGSAFGAIGSTLGSVFQQLAPVFAQLVPLIAQLLPLFNPIGLVLKALIPVLPVLADAFGQIAVAVGTALVSALSQLAPLLPIIAGVLAQIAQVVAAGVMTAVTALVPVVTSLADAFLAILPTIINLVQSVLPPLLGIFETLIPLIAQLVVQFAEFLVPVIEALVPVVQTVFEAIGPIIQAALEIVQGIITAVTGVISGDWSAVWDGVKAIFEGVWNGITAFVQGAVDVLQSILSAAWEVIKPVVESAWNAIKDYIIDPLQAAWDWVSGVFSGIATALGIVWESAKTAATNVLDTLYAVFIKPFVDAKNWVESTFGLIAGAVGGAFTAAKTAAGAVLSTLYDFFIAPFVKVYYWFQNVFTGITSTVQSVVNSVKSAWQDLKNALSEPLKISTNFGPLGALQGNIPGAATGAVVSPVPGGSPFIVGEGGETEIITPVGMMTKTVEDVLARTRIQVDTTQRPIEKSAGDMQVVIYNEGPELTAEAFNAGYREWERRYAPALA